MRTSRTAVIATACVVAVVLLTATPATADAVRWSHLDGRDSGKLASGLSSWVDASNLKRTGDLTPESWWGNDSSWNRYSYVANNPIGYTDPNAEAGAAAIAIGAGAKIAGGTAVGTGTVAAGGVMASGGLGWLIGRTIGGTQVSGTYMTVDDLVEDAWYHAIYNENTNEVEAEQEGNGVQENTNPYAGPVTEDVTVVDSDGNAIPVNEGEQVSASPDGTYQQVRDSEGNETGVRKDNAHKSHKTRPHAHRPDRPDVPNNEDLPIHNGG